VERNDRVLGRVVLNELEVLEMKRSIRSARLLAAVFTAAVAAWPLAQLAYAGPAAPDVPTEIQVLGENKVFLVGHAVGVQSYPCNATSSGYSWGPSTPRADVFDDNGKLITTHYGGPTWEAKDGSKVVGQVAGRFPVANTIPWLKLSAASTAAGPDGDRLEGTTFIQRVATTGGVAPPAADCNAGTVGTREEVAYTADYYFWKATGA
jgi:hypothetical protein